MAAFYSIATFSLKGTGETGVDWTGTVKQWLDSSPGAAADVEIMPRPVLQYGDALARELRPIMESFIEVEFDDAGGVIAAALDSAASDRDLILELRSGSYAWDGYASLGTRQERRYGDARTVVVRFYCGLVHSNDYEHSDALDSVRVDNIIDGGVQQRVRDWVCKHYITWRPRNWRLKSPSAGAVLYDLRLVLGTALTHPSTLANILTDFLARVFQPLTVSDEWRLQQFLTTGQQITVASGYGAYNNPGGLNHAFAIASNEPADTIALTDDDVDFEALNVRQPPRQTERFEPIKPDGITDFRLEVDTGFEHWEDDETLVCWESNGVERENTVVRTGTYSVLIPGNATVGQNWIRQGLAFVTAGDGLRPFVQFYGQGDVLTVAINHRLRIQPLNPADPAYYSTGSGTWSTTDAWVAASGVSASSWQQKSITMVADIPVTGLLIWEFRSGAAAYFLDDARAYARDASGKAYPPLATFGQVASSIFVPSLYNTVQRRYYEQGNDNNLNLMEVDDGTGAEWPVSRWQDEDDTVFWFLHELAAKKRLEMVGAEGFIGTVDAIVPPERAFTLGGKTYAAPSGVSIDLAVGKTRAYWLEKVHTI